MRDVASTVVLLVVIVCIFLGLLAAFVKVVLPDVGP